MAKKVFSFLQEKKEFAARRDTYFSDAIDRPKL